MVKHIIMWKMKEHAEGKDKKENLREMKARLERLKEEIEEIQFLEVGINYNETGDACDIVLYTEFENKKGLEIYQNHTAHMAARDFIRKVRHEKRVVDYEI